MATNAARRFCLSIFSIANGRLLGCDGQPVINDMGLAALALLVAESDPTQKETMIRLTINMLAPESQRQ